MKTIIVYTDDKPTAKDVAELKAVLPLLNITWVKYVGEIKTLGTTQLDFDWLKTLPVGIVVDADIRCFVTKVSTLENLGITKHIGLYNLENDGVHDFYISLPRRLDARAKANGFQSNFAWIFVHEYLHGLVWEETKSFVRADGDVHKWEKDGLLKAKLAEYSNRKQQLTLLQQLLKLLQQLLKATTTPSPTQLLPLVERKADAVIADMLKLGYAMRVTQGFRSIEEQNKLYAQGRTTPGTIITNAKGGESFHNYGVAVDFVFRREGYDVPKIIWDKFAAIGKKHGFEWGGDWTGFVDKPHLQMTLGYTLNDFKSGQVDYTEYK